MDSMIKKTIMSDCQLIVDTYLHFHGRTYSVPTYIKDDQVIVTKLGAFHDMPSPRIQIFPPNFSTYY